MIKRIRLATARRGLGREEFAAGWREAVAAAVAAAAAGGHGHAESLLARIAYVERELAGRAEGDLVRANWFLAVSEDPIGLPR